MLRQGTINVVEKHERRLIKGHEAEVLHLQGGRALVLCQDQIATFKDSESIDDPLGNGMLGIVELPTDIGLAQHAHPWINEHRAGFIGLVNGASMLVLPGAIRLYGSKQDALHNRRILAELPLG